MSKVWLGFAIDHITIFATIFIVLYCSELGGLGVFSVTSFVFLCPLLLVTSIEGPILSESNNWLLGGEKPKGIRMQIAYALLFGLFLSVVVCAIARMLVRSHPLALFSCEPAEPNTGLTTLEEGWLLIKLQYGVCGFCNALFHGVSASFRRSKANN